MNDEFDFELDETIASFDRDRADLNYQQARETLQQILDRLDLSNRERSGLEAEIGDLEKMLAKLDRAVFEVAVFGMVGRGKSSLINALVGTKSCAVGATHGVTRDRQQVVWEVNNWQDEFDWEREEVRKIEEQIEFIDTPGIDEVDGRAREELAQEIGERSDLILFVITGDLSSVEERYLRYLFSLNKPILLVFNQIDRYSEPDRQEIVHKLVTERVKDIVDRDRIMLVAAAPTEAQVGYRQDGSPHITQVKTAPQIDTLKQKIIEILQHEGKTLIALNAMLMAQRIGGKLIDRKLDRRLVAANDAIWQSVMAKAVAVGLNPITAADVIGGAAIDVTLILRLSKIYGIPMTKSGALGLLRTIAIGMGGVGASQLLANLGLSGIKSILATFTPITGGMAIAPYTAVALTQATIAGVSSYALGEITKNYLANGASWGDLTPQAAIEQILATVDRDSIADQIKQELRIKN
jgi:GTPase